MQDPSKKTNSQKKLEDEHKASGSKKTSNAISKAISSLNGNIIAARLDSASDVYKESKKHREDKSSKQKKVSPTFALTCYLSDCFFAEGGG